MSLVDLIKNNKQLNRDNLFFYRAYDAQYASVLSKTGWKLVAYRGDTFELFNIYNDISENNDLSEEKPEKVDKLVKELRNWEKSNDLLLED